MKGLIVSYVHEGIRYRGPVLDVVHVPAVAPGISGQRVALASFVVVGVGVVSLGDGHKLGAVTPVTLPLSAVDICGSVQEVIRDVRDIVVSHEWPK